MSGGAEAGQQPPRVPGTRARSPLSAAGKLSICQTSKPCFSVGLSPPPSLSTTSFLSKVMSGSGA